MCKITQHGNMIPGLSACMANARWKLLAGDTGCRYTKSPLFFPWRPVHQETKGNPHRGATHGFNLLPAQSMGPRCLLQDHSLSTANIICYYFKYIRICIDARAFSFFPLSLRPFDRPQTTTDAYIEFVACSSYVVLFSSAAPLSKHYFAYVTSHSLSFPLCSIASHQSHPPLISSRSVHLNVFSLARLGSIRHCTTQGRARLC